MNSLRVAFLWGHDCAACGDLGAQPNFASNVVLRCGCDEPPAWGWDQRVAIARQDGLADLSASMVERMFSPNIERRAIHK